MVYYSYEVNTAA